MALSLNISGQMICEPLSTLMPLELVEKSFSFKQVRPFQRTCTCIYILVEFYVLKPVRPKAARFNRPFTLVNL